MKIKKDCVCSYAGGGGFFESEDGFFVQVFL